jgi:hypothetical protein
MLEDIPAKIGAGHSSGTIVGDYVDLCCPYGMVFSANQLALLI